MSAVRSPTVADVGARIRSLRVARGLTQAQLAGQSYTKAYVSMLESGRTRASMKALEHIAAALGVQPSDLLGGQTAPAAPQYQLLEARRFIEEGTWRPAADILEKLEEGLTAVDQVVRLRYLAVAYNGLGQPKQAFPVIERAQKMADLLGDESERVRIESVLAMAYKTTYAYDEAQRHLKRCIEACETGVLSDPPFLFRRLVDLANIYSAQRQPKQALAMFERAMALGERFPNRTYLAGVYSGMARSYHEVGDLELAIRYAQRSLDLYEELGLLDQVACMLDDAALLYAEYGNGERARECVDRAAQLAQETEHEGTLASVQATTAEILAKTDPDAALEAALQALKVARKADMVEAQIRTHALLGELRAVSNATAAKRSFNHARQLAEERAPHLLRIVYDRWSRAAEAAGDREEALRLARRALEAVTV
ncbi:MAG: helix-turn-helix transcriptional regulator [Chloroflexi bacterium]|nr:helix-turn-helix transcriptional regulator [Chloroflexota bacterium]